MKKILITLLQITVTALALYFVFKNPQKRADMGNAFRNADLIWVFAALAASLLSPITATLRWGLLLRVQGIALSWGRIIQLYMVGTFFNLFLVGSTGGDAAKIIYLLREPAVRDKRAGAIFAVIMDRLIGLLALILMSGVFVALRYSWLTSTPRSAAPVALFGFIISGAVGFLITTFIVVKARLTDRLPAKLPGRAKIVELAAACEVYATAWRTTLAGIAISLVGHSSFFFVYYFVGRAVRAGVSLWDMSVILPVVNTIVALPISVSGLGVREHLFQDILGALCGVSPEKAVPISLIGFACTVIFSGLVGGVFFLFYRTTTDAPPGPTLLGAERLKTEVTLPLEERVIAERQPDASEA